MEINALTAVFKALSDETRLKIIFLLKDGELCACKILEHFQIVQSTLSHHMKSLVSSGLVVARKEGVWIHYSLNKRKLNEIEAVIEILLNKQEGGE